MWFVDIIEYERGWGSRLDSTEKFDTYDKAIEFKSKFNAENNLIEAPDWYMVAIGPYQK